MRSHGGKVKDDQGLFHWYGATVVRYESIHTGEIFKDFEKYILAGHHRR